MLKLSTPAFLSAIACGLLLLLASCDLFGNDSSSDPGPIEYEIKTLLERNGLLNPVAFSPDGSLILFKGSENGVEHVYVMDRDGSDVRRLTDTPGDRDAAGFSPDGTQVLYSEWSARGWVPGGMPAQDIYVVNVDGTGRRLVVGGTGTERNVAVGFSPDGSRILYNTFYGYEKGWRAFIANADGSNPVQLVDSSANVVSISPEGPEALISLSDGTYIQNLDNKQLVKIADENMQFAPVSFTSDGDKILFYKHGWGGVLLMSRASMDTTLVTYEGAEVAVDISPDGQRILFYTTTAQGICWSCSIGKAYIVNADGTDRTEIRDGNLRVDPVAFSPDSRQILLSVDNAQLVDDPADRRSQIKVAELKE